jgi:glycosyltransferase involved in cell wall biosynthesis
MEAAALLSRKRVDWKIWFVGEPQRPNEINYREKVFAKSHELGLVNQVRFLGWQKQLSTVFASSDAYCQPNIQPEPFGISIVEAMYSGLPVISTPLGGPLETIDSSCGFLVNPGDIQGLAAAMENLFIANNRSSMGNRARVKAREVSNPATQIKKFYSIMQALINVG